MRKITQREGALHGRMRLNNWEHVRLAPMPAIVISRGNDGTQMSGIVLTRDYSSWKTERSLTHVTICAFEPRTEKV